ncbi:hypothetical protein N7535_001160 [Penicillium sp. DV-2018c]|nr:hypothetical protein N7535_001160 [Penicillium sp. DV-2018c]
MHFSKSMLLMTALTAGSAVARLHGHERRHTHVQRDLVDIDLEPVVAVAGEANKVEKRGDMVYATIDGKLVSWINNWFGEQTSASEAAAETTAAPTTISATAPTTTAEATSATEAVSSVSPTPVSGSGSSNWADFPSDGKFSREGFGAATPGKRVGSSDWDYIGNIGSPWGSNIIRVEEDVASKYKHVIRFENENDKAWTVVLWNSYGPSGGLNGFWSPNKALSFTVEPGHSTYVAIDDNSQGGWGAAEGEGIPTNYVGQYASTWGEFDMSSEKNDGFSGWDVSCIIPQLAKMEIDGMRICDHTGDKCSSISKGASKVIQAYTAADQGKPDLAVSQGAGPVRLVVNLGWNS